MQVSEILKKAEADLATVSDAPRIDAERLLVHVLKIHESSWLYAHGEEDLDKKTQKRFEELVRERATGKPLAYILGEWEFYGRPFYVTPDVLVPRPETENLIEEALKYIAPGMTVADVGTGSGVIAVTLARELATSSRRKAADSPFVRGSKSDLFPLPYEGGGGRAERDGVVKILATDISPAALKIAKKNAARHGVADRIEFLQGDMLEPIKNKKSDLIVSNPPYVPSAEINKFEPRLALDGGPDGQRFVEQLAASGVPTILETINGEIISFPSSLLSSQLQA